MLKPGALIALLGSNASGNPESLTHLPWEEQCAHFVHGPGGVFVRVLIDDFQGLIVTEN
jgi:hypothetical protein